MSTTTTNRTRVFLRFEDADYYYRSGTVEELLRNVQTADRAGDDLALVKAYEALGAFLSAGRDLSWRRKFFDDCIRPMSDVFASGEAGGYLHAFLGSQAFSLEVPDYVGYYERAVDLGDESVLGRDDVLRAHPELIIRWVKGRLRDSAKGFEIEECEKLLDRILDSRADAVDYYVTLAEVLCESRIPAADRYYRKCIGLGCERIAYRPEFLTAAYEPEFIEWFRSLRSRGAGHAEAAERCFSRLWKSCPDARAFSESRREYCESLSRDGAMREAVAEYVRAAEEKFDWAERWLHDNASTPMVEQGISDALIESWFGEGRLTESRELTLGCCFDNGRGAEHRGEAKYYACIARFRLAGGNPMGAVQAISEMDVAKHGRERDFMEQSALEAFPEITRDIREALRKDARSLVEKEMESKEHDAVIVDDLEMVPDALPAEDLMVLREYINSGALEVSPFRADGEKPLCSRYMLLAQMEKTFDCGCGSVMSSRTSNHLKDFFGRLADREFKDSVVGGNPMTVCKWLMHNLFASGNQADKVQGEAVLYRMIARWRRGDDELPVKLLAGYWKHVGRDSTSMLALRIFLEKDRELEKWVNAKDPKELFSLAYESLSGAFRK